MRKQVIGLQELRSGNVIVEAPETLSDGLFELFAALASSQLSAAHAKAMLNAEADNVPDVPEHSFFRLPSWVPQDVRTRLVEEFGEVGFPFTTISGEMLVIARSEYVPQKGVPHVEPILAGPFANRPPFRQNAGEVYG